MSTELLLIFETGIIVFTITGNIGLERVDVKNAGIIWKDSFLNADSVAYWLAADAE